MDDSAGSSDIEKAVQRFLAYALLPAWMTAGFADYLCHRKSKIERTSGTHESLTHMLMIVSAGAGVMASLCFEVNESVLAIMAGSALTHEAVVLWDVGYAAKLRPPSATEQHVHSFLEVLPFAGLAFVACLNPGDVAVLFGRGSRPFRWKLEPKHDPATPIFTTTVIAAATLLQVLPHMEELIRCFSVDHTFLPHERPIDRA
jgi:hypothetical protein